MVTLWEILNLQVDVDQLSADQLSYAVKAAYEASQD